MTLNGGLQVLLDEEDYRTLNKVKWQADKHGYAIRTERRNGKVYRVSMSRLIMNMTKNNGLVVDHINGCVRDNRRKNLRVCTQAQNLLNRRGVSSNKSGFKGVSWYPPLKKWRARVKIGNAGKHLGYFDTPEQAANAYNAAAKDAFGEFFKPS
jgi:hypothetical protein